MPISLIRTVCAAAVIAVTLCAPIASVGVARAQTASNPANPVNLSSEVKIERIEKDVTGEETVMLRDPKDVVVVPGDKVIFTLSVVNSGLDPAVGFRAVNPVPAAVKFVAVDQDWAEVSVDGGASWGKLSALTVSAKTEDTGVAVTRAAGPEDVTHVRWVFADAIAAGSKSSVSYRGVVK